MGHWPCSVMAECVSYLLAQVSSIHFPLEEKEQVKHPFKSSSLQKAAWVCSETLGASTGILIRVYQEFHRAAQFTTDTWTPISR